MNCVSQAMNMEMRAQLEEVGLVPPFDHRWICYQTQDLKTWWQVSAFTQPSRPSIFSKR